MTSPLDFATRFCGIARKSGSRDGEILRNNLLFHKESGVLAQNWCRPPATGELVLRTAHNLIVENDDITATLVSPPKLARPEVMAEICHHLAPFQTGEKPITGQTVIAKDLAIDSLAIMDMVMELEDRFDISIPMNVVAEIHTVDELADTILKLAARR
jgi:acyl carrier protein